MMRVAIVVWDLSVSGGTQRQALELARQLQSNKVSVDVYTLNLDKELCYPDLIKDLNIITPGEAIPNNTHTNRRIRKIPLVGGGLYQLLEELYWPFHAQDKSIDLLARCIKANHYDIINAHDSPSQHTAVNYAHKNPKTKIVWMSNDMPWIFQVLDQQGMPGLRRLVRQPGRSTLILYERHRQLRIADRVDQIVVLDFRNQKIFQKLVGITPKVIRSGLDTTVFKPKLKKDNRIFTVLAAGIFFRYRRFEDLIEAVSLLKNEGVDVNLKIIGSDKYDPSYGKELLALVKRLKITDQVEFLGRVDEAELLEQYRDADLFVFPNHNQTWGLAPFEALASGTPVLVSKTAGAHEVLADGKNALFINPMQPEDIAAKVSLLYNNDRLRLKLAGSGLSFVKKNMSWQLYAKNMLETFEEVSTGSRRKDG